MIVLKNKEHWKGEGKQNLNWKHHKERTAGSINKHRDGFNAIHING